jgi:predicted ATPase
MSKSPLDREFDAGSGLSVASLPTRGSSASSRGDRRGGAGSAGGATAGNSFASSSLRSSVVQPRSEDFSIEKIAKDLTTVMADEEEIRERELQMALTRQQFTINRLNLGELEVYGRDKEVAVLTELFQAVSTARAAAGEKAKKEASVGVVNVVGKAGTGKSRLCKELRNKVASRKGFFLTGKFDLQNRKEPYAGILSALADLPAQVSALGETYRSELCARLQDAIGDESHILTVLVPGLKELFPSSDERSSEPSDDKFDTRSVRLHYIFRQFIGSISCPEHPVVFVVDDMHWTDSSSLLLLANLVTDKKLSSFLLLATYREEETDDAHPAIKTFAELQDHPNVALRSISIAALDQMATYSIVSTALRSSEEKTIKLSEIVHQKSNGNAMYTIQFLISLYEDGLLRYNLGLMQWTWDELSVRSRSVTDNVVDLASEKLHRLDSTSRAILQIASCLGQTFDKVKLVYVMDDARVQGLLAASGQADEKPPEESRSDLTSCLDGLVQEAVIDYIHQLDTYCFVHDLIQEAASTLIPEETRAQLQSAVGRRLLQSEMPLDDKFFFRAVELSNIGSDQLDEQEKLKLAQFNETAAHKATAKAAFSSALRYNEEGMRCLGAEAWTKHRALALSLSSGAVEAAFCSGDFATMETRMTSVLSQPIPIEDKVRVYLTRILSYSAQDRNELCLATGRRVLMDMGMTTLPKRPGTQHVILEFLKTKLALRKQTEQSLKELPVLEDERWYQAMSIIDMMQAVAYCSNQNLFAVMNLRLLRWTVKYGVCRFSPTVFATYGIILCTLNEIADGQMMGKFVSVLRVRLHLLRSSRR